MIPKLMESPTEKMKDLNSRCPVCQYETVEPVLKISRVPVHCNLLFSSRDAAQNTPRGDIHLAYCINCGHLYNAAFRAENMNYEGEYENSLHYSPSFQAYAETLAASLVKEYGLQGKNIIEIGAGRGDFLQMLCQPGENYGTGFDPSFVPDDADPQNGRVRIFRDYYTREYAHLPVDFMVSRHVFEHLANPAELTSTLREMIADRLHTVVFIEVPNAAWTIEDLGIWDLIYEHYSYFTRYSLEYLLVQAGFVIDKIEEKFNRQFLTVAARPGAEKNEFLGSEGSVTTNPSRPGSTLPQAFTDLVKRFSNRYHEKFNHWQQTLNELRDQSMRAVIWGAGSKGVTFSNVIASQGVITHVVDINPRKQGKFTAGSGIEIISPQLLPGIRPDKIILMNENYEAEVRNYLLSLDVQAQIIIA